MNVQNVGDANDFGIKMVNVNCVHIALTIKANDNFKVLNSSIIKTCLLKSVLTYCCQSQPNWKLVFFPINSANWPANQSPKKVSLSTGNHFR